MLLNVPDDPNDIMDAAIANEIEGYNILQRGKRTANDPLARATFEFLANEELKHIEIIKEFTGSITGIRSWSPDSLKERSIQDAGSNIRNIFERFAVQFEETNTSDEERLEVYRIAMDMERRGYEFYTQAADKVSSEHAKKIFRFLAGEETRHFQIIQDTHDFLEQPDAILAMEERWMQI